MNIRIHRIDKKVDARGELVVFKDYSADSFGQIYFVSFNGSGISRGNHYHKKWKEWFGVVTGRIRVDLEDVFTGAKDSFVLCSSTTDYWVIEICPYIKHTFTSLSDDAILLNYASGKWDKEDDYK